VALNTERMKMKFRIKCGECDGDGWNIDHSDRHYQTGDRETCEQAGCPIQRPCDNCKGQGYFEYEDNDYSENLSA